MQLPVRLPDRQDGADLAQEPEHVQLHPLLHHSAAGKAIDGDAAQGYFLTCRFYAHELAAMDAVAGPAHHGALVVGDDVVDVTTV